MSRWTFYDPVSVTTYSFDVNPNQDSPTYQKNIQFEAVVVPGSPPLIYEGHDSPTTFSVQGTLLSEAQFKQLLFFFQLRHQFLCTDDLGRQRWIYLTEFQPVRTPNAVFPWKHTYTLTGLLISEVLP